MQYFSDLFKYPILLHALYASMLASAACGVLGAYVVARRSSYMVGAVSHSLLGGIGLARFCQAVLGLAFFTPMCGAVMASLVVSAVITAMSANGKGRVDAILSAIWTVGVAIGVCFVAAIPGYAEDLNSYLFGNIMLVSGADLRFMAALDAFILPAAWLFHSRLVAYCFHEEGLELRGVSTFGISLLLNVLVGLAVVLLSQTVGIVMVLALMVLPAATAARISRRLHWIMLMGAFLCFLACLAGMAISYAKDWPSGAVIILVTAIAYAIVATAAWCAARLRARRVERF